MIRKFMWTLSHSSKIKFLFTIASMTSRGSQEEVMPLFQYWISQRLYQNYWPVLTRVKMQLEISPVQCSYDNHGWTLITYTMAISVLLTVIRSTWITFHYSCGAAFQIILRTKSVIEYVEASCPLVWKSKALYTQCLKSGGGAQRDQYQSIFGPEGTPWSESLQRVSPVSFQCPIFTL